MKQKISGFRVFSSQKDKQRHDLDVVLFANSQSRFPVFFSSVYLMHLKKGSKFAATAEKKELKAAKKI